MIYRWLFRLVRLFLLKRAWNWIRARRAYASLARFKRRRGCQITRRRAHRRDESDRPCTPVGRGLSPSLRPGRPPADFVLELDERIRSLASTPPLPHLGDHAGGNPPGGGRRRQGGPALPPQGRPRGRTAASYVGQGGGSPRAAALPRR